MQAAPSHKLCSGISFQAAGCLNAVLAFACMWMVCGHTNRQHVILKPHQRCVAACMQVTGRRPATQFVSVSETVSFKLKDDLKKRHLTLQNVDRYNAVLKSSGLLAPEGPCDLIDMHILSQGEGQVLQ